MDRDRRDDRRRPDSRDGKPPPRHDNRPPRDNPSQPSRRDNRDRSRSPPRRDTRNDNRRQRSPPRGPARGGAPPSRGPPPRQPHSNDRGPPRQPYPNTNNASRTKPPAAPEKIMQEIPEDEDEEAMMARIMGFKGFRTTKNTKVPGNDKNYGVNKAKKSEYRQYMNRVGGFNRPLSPGKG